MRLQPGGQRQPGIGAACLAEAARHVARAKHLPPKSWNCSAQEEPIVEADFYPTSYGFRPWRSVHGAKLDLALSEEKTLVTPVTDTMAFLGHHQSCTR